MMPFVFPLLRTRLASQKQNKTHQSVGISILREVLLEAMESAQGRGGVLWEA